MITEQMREEFERTNGRDHRRQPPKGNNYIDPMAQMDWESFQKGWLQSRAVIKDAEYCSEHGRCVCGGDTEGVRRTCGNWVIPV